MTIFLLVIIILCVLSASLWGIWAVRDKGKGKPLSSGTPTAAAAAHPLSAQPDLGPPTESWPAPSMSEKPPS